MVIHAEIEYINDEGISIHSDVCPSGCLESGLKDANYREFLHTVLDEWLDLSNGSGGFYIKNESFNFDFQDEEGV